MSRSCGRILAIVWWLSVPVLAATACDGGGGAPPSGTAGATGAAGAATSGVAGAAGTAGASGSAGAVGTAGGGAGTSGSAGSPGSAGNLGASGAARPTPDAGGGPDGPAPGDAKPINPDGPHGDHGNKVLIYSKTTGFRHGSIGAATTALTKAATAAGLVVEASEDPAKFTPAGLAPYAAIVLLATTGEPFGAPGTTQVQTLLDWVRAGGALVGIENCNHAYDDNPIYVNLMGGDFNGHSAGTDTCVTEADHPTTKHLAKTFMVTDEIYYFTKFRLDNVVVLRCGSDKRPISWVRDEGAGRFFYTALGHDDFQWTKPPLVDGHVLPGLLWAMGRDVP